MHVHAICVAQAKSCLQAQAKGFRLLHWQRILLQASLHKALQRHSSHRCREHMDAACDLDGRSGCFGRA